MKPIVGGFIEKQMVSNSEYDDEKTPLHSENGQTKDLKNT